MTSISSRQSTHSTNSDSKVTDLTIEIPDEMYCPITGEIMNQPMMSPRGHSYEKTAILKHLLEYAERSPLTNEPLQPHRLRENRGLKSAIETLVPFIKDHQRFNSNRKTAIFTKEHTSNRETILSQITTKAHYKNGRLYITTNVPDSLTRDPINAVLCLDISGSMSNEATKLDENGTRISHGLTLLDITCGGAIAVLKCLDNRDRASIVSYSNNAVLEEDWTVLDEDGKNKLIERLKSLRTRGSTNLSDGITKSLNQFKKSDCSVNAKNTAFVFTDGVPNIIPPKGHEFMIEQWKENNSDTNVITNTFGFGFDLDDVLLKSVSKLGGGEYNFIPDSAMVGDIMTHAISNVIATVLENAKLTIQLSNGATFDGENAVMGESVVTTTSWGKIIDINSLKYGQSRNNILKITVPDEYKDDPSKCIEVFLTFKNNSKDTIISAELNTEDIDDSAFDIEYIRYMFVDTINNCISKLDNDCLNNDSEVVPFLVNDHVRANCNWGKFYSGVIVKIHSNGTCDIKFDDGDLKLRVDIRNIKPKNCGTVRLEIDHLLQCIDMSGTDTKNSPYVKDLILDIKGQVTEALNLSTKMKSGEDWYNKWGRKFLLSMVGAHNDERCNSSKDASVQHFSTRLFEENFVRAEQIYSTLPAPKPTKTSSHSSQNSIRRAAPRTYASYNCSGPCFTGDSLVRMLDGTLKKVADMTKGDYVFADDMNGLGTSKTGVKIIAVTKTKITNGTTSIVQLNKDLGITPNHPVIDDDKWIHPDQLKKSEVVKCNHVYNFVLNDYHIVIIGGVSCCTLGHCFKGPVIEHDYYGTDKVLGDLYNCKGWNDGLIVLHEEDIIRSSTTGWVNGINITQQYYRN